MDSRRGAVRSLATALAVGAALLSAGPGAAADAGRFVVVSDIHLDPFDPPHLAKDLAAADPSGWPAILARIEAQDYAGYGADTNHALFASALAAIAEAGADADFIVVPGDLLAHRFEDRAAAALGRDGGPATVRALAAKTSVYVAEAIAGALPGRPLLLSLGNNDSGCGDYRIEPGGPYLEATLAAVRRLADPQGRGLLADDFEATYSAGGYFAMRHPTVPGATVLLLNDVLWSEAYRDACGGDGTEAADAMLVWLEDRLTRAEADGTPVWLIHHIPAGIDAYSTSRRPAGACPARVTPFLREPYAGRFVDLLARHARTIRASIGGHIHHDGYRLLLDAGGEPAGVDKIAAAISPVFGQNPGFHVFDYDRGTGSLRDFTTWYITDLGQASLAAPGTWREEYRFTDAYGQPDYSAASVDALWREMTAGSSGVRDTFRRLYPVSHGALGEADLAAFLCAMGHLRQERFTACYCGG